MKTAIILLIFVRVYDVLLPDFLVHYFCSDKKAFSHELNNLDFDSQNSQTIFETLLIISNNYDGGLLRMRYHV